jgi:thiol-disulfide isomerase/thioredoxin
MGVRELRGAEVRTPVAVLASAVLAFGCGAGEAAPGSPDGASPASAAADTASSPEPLEPAESGATESDGPGAYVTLAEFERDPAAYAGDVVVLFFTAPWCSSCKQTRESIEADLDGIPSGLVIVTVDYDTEEALKRAHGVTVQHTFVQVDGDGATLKKWTGSLTAEAIAEQTV